MGSTEKSLSVTGGASRWSHLVQWVYLLVLTMVTLYQLVELQYIKKEVAVLRKAFSGETLIRSKRSSWVETGYEMEDQADSTITYENVTALIQGPAPDPECCQKLKVPEFVGGVGPITVSTVAGNTVILPCNATANPIPSVSWERDGVGLPENRSVVITGLGLVIDNAQVQDTGSYSCIAINILGSNTKNFILQVYSGEPVVRPVQKFVGVRPGDTVDEGCVVTNIAQQPKITYTRVDGKLPIHQVLPSGDIVFRYSSLVDSGEYHCEALTEKGLHTASFFVYQNMSTLTCATPFQNCASEGALCGGDCPAGCSKLNLLYPVTSYAVNLPVCGAALTSGKIGLQGGPVVYHVSKNVFGLLEANFLNYTTTQR